MPAPRFFQPERLHCGAALTLDANATRHVQVLRLQPGARITLFDGHGGEYAAVVEHIGKKAVQVAVGAHDSVEREAARDIHLALGIPANERMDWLVEKATELGVTSIQPLLTERTVLRLPAERAEKKRAHWRAIAIAACEQCGRNRVPALHPAAALADWLDDRAKGETVTSPRTLLLSLRATAMPLSQAASATTGAICFLSGPEGGLSDAEEDAAMRAGCAPVSLGPRVLRAETAALAALASWVQMPGPGSG